MMERLKPCENIGTSVVRAYISKRMRNVCAYFHVWDVTFSGIYICNNRLSNKKHIQLYVTI